MAGGAKFTAVPGLNEMVAQMCVDGVQRAADEVARRAKENAPPLKVWVTVGDYRVRPEHKGVSHQKVPVNLRFTLRSTPWDMKEHGVGPWTYMMEPRDETSHAEGNIINCRCWVEFQEDGVAKLVQVEQASAEGTKATATVFAEGDLVYQAEYGDVYTFGNVSDGTFFMERAAAEVQALMR